LAPLRAKALFIRLHQNQCELALIELIKNSSLIPGAILLQSVVISKWLIEGQPTATQSQIKLCYGIKPCISTFLQFETTGQFEFIKRVFFGFGLLQAQRETLEANQTRIEEEGWSVR